MSSCGEFAEHVWKPGSCKNCFHPRSAHNTGPVPVFSRMSVGDSEDGDGVTFSSPCTKPTIAVRPTMMSADCLEMEANGGTSREQDYDNSTRDRLELKKVLDLGPLYIGNNICSTVLKETVCQSAVLGKVDYSSRFSPGALTSKDSRAVSNTCETHIDSLGPQTLMQNGCSPSHMSQMNSVEHTLTSKSQRHQEASLPFGPDLHQASLSDSCSFCSSTDSVTGPSDFYQIGLETNGTIFAQNGPTSAEPIYAESAKCKRKPQWKKKEQQQQSELELEEEVKVGDSQRTTITVMAAHTEKNNRTFYLSSPDSAVCTQWPHFSPPPLPDSRSPTFKWPTPLSLSVETAFSGPLHPKSQRSPPLPPKRNPCSPRLGTSSLSLTHLPDLNSMSTASTVFKSHHSNSQSVGLFTSNAMERRQKLSCSTLTSEAGIEEEEEEELEAVESVADKVELCEHPANEASAVSKEHKDYSSSMQGERGTTDNGASQEQAAVRVTQGTSSGSMLAARTTAASRIHGHHDLAKGKLANRETTPPPPPPKKQHRPCPKMSRSSAELDQRSQRGSVDSLAQSPQGVGSMRTTGSTDSLQPDVCGLDGPFSTSLLVSVPSSPCANSTLSSSLAQQPQPPPLPEKKLINRTLSAPGETRGKVASLSRPHLPLCVSEQNVSRSEVGPSSSVDAQPFHSSSDCLDKSPPPLNRSLCSPIDKEARLGVAGRLSIHRRGSVTTASSPQLSSPASPAPGPSGSTLHLQTLLSNMDSRECIYSKLGGLYAESLRRLAIKCEEHFTRSQRSTLHFDESNWSLFKLTCNKPSCQAGDAIYYSASCASDASNPYAVKICKGTSADLKQGDFYGLTIQQSLPPHFNVQQDCGHFIACVPQSMLPSEELSAASVPSTMVSSAGQSEQEHVVVITNEVPYQTTSDFVRDWAPFHKAQPEVYERRICFLLLQLCNGLEHLKASGVTHRDLCLENLLLVSHGQAGHTLDPQSHHLPRLIISNFTKAKQRSTEGPAKTDPRLKRDHARLAPEIVSAAQYRKFDEFQVGILIYELLHQPNPFEVSPALKEQEYRCEDLPLIPSVSLYSSGLQRLACLLLQSDPIKRIHIQDAKRVLQSLLWGPRRDMMEQYCSRSGGSSRTMYEGQGEGLLNWLDVKRALLMMKFAERSLEPERNAELEDWLCCQYFSTAHPLSLCHTAELLYSLKVPH